MSWWDTSKGFSSLASQALKSAQQKIDKVLDIKDEEAGQSASIQQTNVTKSSSNVSQSSDLETGGGDEFWNDWLGSEKLGLNSSPMFSSSSSTKKSRKKSGPDKQVIESIEEDVDQSEVTTGTSSSVFKKTKVKAKSQVSPIYDDSSSAEKIDSFTEAVSETQDVNAFEIGELTSNDTDVLNPSPKPDGSQNQAAKKRAPLKLSIKSSANKDKSDRKSGEKESSQIVEEMLKREKEAEIKLMEMLENNESESILDNQALSPAMKSDVNEQKVTEQSKDQNSQILFHKMSNENVKSDPTTQIEKVDENNRLMDKADADDSDVEKNGMLLGEKSRLSSDMSVSAMSVDVTQCDWGDAGLITDSQLLDTLESTEDDRTEEQEPSKNPAESDEFVNVDGSKCEILKSGDEQTDVHECLKTATEGKDSQKLTEDSESIVCKSEAEIENIVAVQSDEKQSSLQHVQSTSSTFSTLEGSLSSDTNDELSSSNQTLTAEDFQSSVHSNKSSDKENDREDDDVPDAAAVVEGHSVEGNTDSVDLPLIHSSSTEEPLVTEPEHYKDTSAAVDSAQFTGGADNTNQPPQSMTASHSSQCSSSSYVKNMLEEAIKDVDSRSDSISHSSSDMVRIESDQNSGHTSGDDMETATSSDIEIISRISTPNGENRGFVTAGTDKQFDLSPLRHAFGRTTVRRNSPPGHKRSDSGSSAYSLQSKNGDDVTSPTDDSQHRRHLHFDSNNDPTEKEKLLKKLAEMAEVLEAREKKLVDLSRSNMDLMETNSILKNQLQQSEEAREAEMTDLNQLTEEFTKRISDAEKRLQQAAKEKEQMKKTLQDTELTLARRSDSSNTAEKLLLEKDTQINELLAEGEKLSKQQLQSNNVIKKLRSKEKENEAVMKSQKDKVESQKCEIERLQKVLDNKCDVEKKQTESIDQLQSVVKRQEKEVEKYKSELEDNTEKVRSMEAALDSSYKEIAELHKANVTKATVRQEQALSQEIQAKQELQSHLERYQLTAKQEQEALLYQIEDLRLSMSRMEKEHGRREDVLRQEISDLQQRMQEGEDRNQELTSSVTAATRPLLRQIENLQSTYTAHSTSYEKVERNLTERLAEAQKQLAMAQEKERVATEELMDLETKVSSYETQLSSLRQDKSRLQAQLEMEKTKNQVLEDAKNKEYAQREAMQHSLEDRLSELKKEKLLLENQLEMEKLKLEAEKKKLILAHEQLRDKDLQLSQVKTLSRSSTPSDSLLMKDGTESGLFTSMATSMSQSFLSQGEDIEKSFVLTPSRGSNQSFSVYDSLRNSGAATVMENLQSQLKQKEGEIVQLQSEIHELERTRESMARELVNLSNENEELKETVTELPQARSQYNDLDQRYNALLQMYGEKVEETQELKLDLQDVKDLYKNQIDELLRKS